MVVVIVSWGGSSNTQLGGVVVILSWGGGIVVVSWGGG